MFYLWWICREDGLALNAVAGIKTTQTMASEETWLYIHRKYRVVFCVAGVIIAVMCMALVAYIVVTNGVGRVPGLPGCLSRGLSRGFWSGGLFR